MAHAAVVSLQQKLQGMLKGDNANYLALRQAVSCWHAFLEDSLLVRSAPEVVDYLEKRVKCLTTQLLDSINLYELEKRSPYGYPQSWKVIQEEAVTAGSDSINEYLKKVMNARNDIDALPISDTMESDSEYSPILQDTVLDLDIDLMTVKSQLVGPPSNLDVISIVGMGGIGKTTLARQVYDDIYMEHHFYIRAWITWITVSQMHQHREMIVNRDTEECLDLLELSYNHLPHHLKPCFLYMGAFPKGFEISVSRLIKLWIAAEYVRCKPEKDFEEVAEGYLSDLIGWSLIMVKKKTSSGKVKTCEVHDLLHDLILREVWKERSIYFAKSNVIVSPPVASFEHRIIFNFGVAPLTHIEHVYDKSSLPRASSFLCFERDGTPGSCSQVDSFITFTNFKWLTVLDMCFQPFDHLPSEIWNYLN